eukprot:GHVT01059293.1.p1 GENE.GHVT01059293.1~~GHVT01059293.1.p1  ORF type:complete len:152 (-),score=3.12 GHVT01059293.1:620-1075(-)
MKGTLRNTMDRRRTCRLDLPDLKFDITLPTKQELQVYTDASEEGTGFAWQVQHRTAMGLFFPARTQAWQRAVGLHREAHWLYTLATRTQGLWKAPMNIHTESLPLQRKYTNNNFNNLRNNIKELLAKITLSSVHYGRGAVNPAHSFIHYCS